LTTVRYFEELAGRSDVRIFEPDRVRTVRAEVTDRMLIAGPRHLHAVMDEYVSHYNEHRPHRARNLRSPDRDDITMAAVTDRTTVKIRRRKVLGGLVHEYERAA
jgi:putative transposase